MNNTTSLEKARMINTAKPVDIAGGSDIKEVTAVERIFHTLESISNISHDIARREALLADNLLGAIPQETEKEGVSPGISGVIPQIQDHLDSIKATLNKIQAEQFRYEGVING